MKQTALALRGEMFCAWKDSGTTFHNRTMPPLACLKNGCVGGPFAERPECSKFRPLIEDIYDREVRPDRRVVLKGTTSKK